MISFSTATTMLAAACVSLAACAPQTPSSAEDAIQFRVNVPADTPTVFMTGNLDSLGPWSADALAMTGDGTTRMASMTVPDGHTLEYKFTLGSWDREAVDARNFTLPNFRLEPGDRQPPTHTLVKFKNTQAYIATPDEAGILGTLTYWQDFASNHLSETRHVSIWTPPGYSDRPDKRYRVIYMSDGQNLFDPRLANTATDWGVDEAMMRVVDKTGTDPAIVVSTWSTAKRGEEYSPWHGALDYAAFLIEELMPRIDSEYRTLTGPQNTFHIGSSMGGLLSYYLVTKHPETFGACGCMSTHFALSEKDADQYFMGGDGEGASKTPFIEQDIAGGLIPPATARYWFDYGTLNLDANYGPPHEKVRAWLLANGFEADRNFVIREYNGADHNEASWRARLDDVLTFLLTPEAN